MSEQDTPIGDAAAAAITTPGAAAAAPGTSLALPTEAELVQLLGAAVIPVPEWIAALTKQAEFEDTDEEDAALSIVRAILLAATPEEVFGAMVTQSVDDLLGKDPGARSQVFEIYGATPLKSTYEEGPSCFAVIRAYDLSEKQPVTLSCGGRAVQAAILAHMLHGWLPMRAYFTRRRKPTRAGFYPINLESGV